jgi:GNAT superfamily N-acetyltransferase
MAIPTPTVCRLGPGDDALLARLATEGPDFDLEGRDEPETPLTPAASARFLANPAVLYWVAFDGDEPVGLLFCLHLPMPSGDGEEVLLHEIGVRRAWRRRGIGRALLAALTRWMREAAVPEVWVLADNPGATAFYTACGFVLEDDQPTYLTRRRAAPTA